MARIDQELFQKLQKKLGVERSRLYDLIRQKVAETHLDRHLAAIVLAMDKGLNIHKYATSEDLEIIRGGSRRGNAKTQNGARSSPSPRPIKVLEPISLNISFVHSPELKTILSRDISELNVARSQGLAKTAKTCMVLAGSIAEALLLDVLQHNKKKALSASTLPKKPPTDLEKWDLYTMVSVATSMSPSLLPSDAASGATQLRKWRNLIHPGRELRETRSNRIKPTAARASTAIAFLQLVAEELS